MNNADCEEEWVNDNIVLDVYIICQKSLHIQVIKKMMYSYVLINIQSNLSKRPQSAANDVESVEYRRLHHVWILTLCYSRVTFILHDSWLTTDFLSPFVL